MEKEKNKNKKKYELYLRVPTLILLFFNVFPISFLLSFTFFFFLFNTFSIFSIFIIFFRIWLFSFEAFFFFCFLLFFSFLELVPQITTQNHKNGKLKWKYAEMSECMSKWIYPKAITQPTNQTQSVATPNIEIWLVHKSSSQCI